MLHLYHAFQKLITFIDCVVDLDIVMAMYNILKYNDNDSIISGSLWNYCRDGVMMLIVNSNNTIASRPFEYKKKSNR